MKFLCILMRSTKMGLIPKKKKTQKLLLKITVAAKILVYSSTLATIDIDVSLTFQNGVFLAPVMSVPFLLFSGFFVSFDAIPVYLRWITYLSYIRYGFEGTAIATYGYNRSLLDCHQVRTNSCIFLLIVFSRFLLISNATLLLVFIKYKY